MSIAKLLAPPQEEDILHTPNQQSQPHLTNQLRHHLAPSILDMKPPHKELTPSLKTNTPLEPQEVSPNPLLLISLLQAVAKVQSPLALTKARPQAADGIKAPMLPTPLLVEDPQMLPSPLQLELTVPQPAMFQELTLKEKLLTTLPKLQFLPQETEEFIPMSKRPPHLEEPRKLPTTLNTLHTEEAKLTLKPLQLEAESQT